MRVTIVSPDSTNKKLRALHSKLIPEFQKSLSFSKVIDAVVLVGLENLKMNQLIKEIEKKL